MKGKLAIRIMGLYSFIAMYGDEEKEQMLKELNKIEETLLKNLKKRTK